MGDKPEGRFLFSLDDDLIEFVPTNVAEHQKGALDTSRVADGSAWPTPTETSPTTAAFPESIFSSDLYAAIHGEASGHVPVRQGLPSLLGDYPSNFHPFVYQGFPHHFQFSQEQVQQAGFQPYLPVAVLSPEQAEVLQRISPDDSERQFVAKPPPFMHSTTIVSDRSGLYGDPHALQPGSTVVGSPTALVGMRPTARKALEDIMSKYHVRVNVKRTDQYVELELHGTWEAVESSKLRVLQLLDSLVRFI